jgi:predicted DNA-binding protein
MKDAVLTIRLSTRLRRRVEELAHREGRSLSQQAGRLIERGIEGGEESSAARPGGERRSLSAALPGGAVPTLAEFREVRSLISRSLAGELEVRAHTRR